jgi:hypothetical protein
LRINHLRGIPFYDRLAMSRVPTQALREQ